MYQHPTAYHVWGWKSLQKPVVILIHGCGLNHKIWKDYLFTFAKNYRILTYDLLGHGESDCLTPIKDLKHFSSQLLDLMNFLQIDQAYLVGFSLGGMINRRMAIDFPRRVLGLIILNSPHKRSNEAQKIVEARVEQTRKEGVVATINTTLERWFTENYRENYREEVQRIKSEVLENDAQRFIETRSILAKGVLELITPNSPITLPTLIMTCQNDTGSTPQMSIEISKEMDGELEIVPNLKHMGLVEKPAIFLDRILKFLNDCENKKKG